MSKISRSNTTGNAPITISIVIVNYKVKEYVLNLLNSLKKARHSYQLEIFVVDNHSGDGSIEYLKEHHPDVQYIDNKENVGFGRANNQAIKQATGKYTLIINPDTLVSEDTLDEMVCHLEEHPTCGAAGCKILNPDGSFAPESRRSVPTMSTAITKALGLNHVLPKNKYFGKYYMSELGEDDLVQVPVLSGAFMFWRTNLLKTLGGFDERFFMYGEDIDLCYRVQQTKYHIDYVPYTSIIHYKGESTKKGDLRYIRIFNKALYQFFDKHHSFRYSRLFKVFIYLAIWLKTLLSFIGSNLQKIRILAPDLLILNGSLVLGFILRYALKGENILNAGGLKYLWITAIASLLYLIIVSATGFLRHGYRSLAVSLRNLSVTYAGIVMITFFVRDLAFTRLGLIFGFAMGLVLFIGYTLLRAKRTPLGSPSDTALRNARVLIVGDRSHAEDISSKVHGRPDWHYEVIGRVDVNVQENERSALGSLSQLKELITAYHIDQVFFVLRSISYKQMLKEVAGLQHEGVMFKLIPDSMDFILGKSHVEYLESIPLVEVALDYTNGMNKFLKRALDLLIAVPLSLALFILLFPALWLHKNKLQSIHGLRLYKEVVQHKWKNRLRLLMYVVIGKLSLVGSPIVNGSDHGASLVQKGLTGLVQINQSRIDGEEEAEDFVLYYAQNYSIWMDLDILVKSLYQGTDVLKRL